MNATDLRYQKARLQTQREYAFWNAVIDVPVAERTRAQRRHVLTRQKKGRLVALETILRGRAK